MTIGDWSEEDLKNGLREPGGALVGGLNVFDYAKGHADFKAGNAPPSVTSSSYDLGRRRASEEAEAKADFLAMLEQRQRESEQKVRQILKDHPDILRECEQKMVEIREKGFIR